MFNEKRELSFYLTGATVLPEIPLAKNGSTMVSEIPKYKLGKWEPLVTKVIESVISDRRGQFPGNSIAERVKFCFWKYRYNISVDERLNLLAHIKANDLTSPWFMVTDILPHAHGFSNVLSWVADAIAALMVFPDVAELLLMPIDELQFWVALQEPNRELIFALRALTDSDEILCNTLLSELTSMTAVL